LFLALIARSSLRRPYLEEIPNLWPWPALTAGWRRLRLVLQSPPRLRRAVTARSAATVTSLLLLLVGGCAYQRSVYYPGPTRLPTKLVPSSLGQITFQREPAAEVAYRDAGTNPLVSTGQVY